MLRCSSFLEHYPVSASLAFAACDENFYADYDSPFLSNFMSEYIFNKYVSRLNELSVF